LVTGRNDETAKYEEEVHKQEAVADERAAADRPGGIKVQQGNEARAYPPQRVEYPESMPVHVSAHAHPSALQAGLQDYIDRDPPRHMSIASCLGVEERAAAASFCRWLFPGRKK